MSTGRGNDLPDYSGGNGRDPYAGGYDPYSGAHDPYGGGHDPYSGGYDPYGQPELAPSDPYAAGPEGADPYARDPLDADGFGPVFSSAVEHGAPAHGAPQPYGAPTVSSTGYPPRLPGPTTSSSAITSLVLGILSLTMCAGLTAPVGVIFGVIGMKATGPAATDPRSGRGLAIAGLVTSLIGLIPFLLMVFYVVIMIVAIAVEVTAV